MDSGLNTAADISEAALVAALTHLSMVDPAAHRALLRAAAAAARPPHPLLPPPFDALMGAPAAGHQRSFSSPERSLEGRPQQRDDSGGRQQRRTRDGPPEGSAAAALRPLADQLHELTGLGTDALLRCAWEPAGGSGAVGEERSEGGRAVVAQVRQSWLIGPEDVEAVRQLAVGLEPDGGPPLGR